MVRSKPKTLPLPTDIADDSAIVPVACNNGYDPMLHMAQYYNSLKSSSLGSVLQVIETIASATGYSKPELAGALIRAPGIAFLGEVIGDKRCGDVMDTLAGWMTDTLLNPGSGLGKVSVELYQDKIAKTGISIVDWIDRMKQAGVAVTVTDDSDSPPWDTEEIVPVFTDPQAAFVDSLETTLSGLEPNAPVEDMVERVLWVLDGTGAADGAGYDVIPRGGVTPIEPTGQFTKKYGEYRKSLAGKLSDSLTK